MDSLVFTSQVLPLISQTASSVGGFATAESKNGQEKQPFTQQPVGAVEDGARENKIEQGPDADKSPDVNELIEQLEKIAENLHLVDNTRLSISFREDVSKFIYRGIDRDTGEVISEYPSEEILNRLSKFHELAGLSVDIES
jgi:flagellar protein FlaG